jgi:CHAD domain-containing protein
VSAAPYRGTLTPTQATAATAAATTAGQSAGGAPVVVAVPDPADRPAPPPGSGPLSVGEDASLATVVRAGLHNGIARVLEQRPVILDDVDPEGVHQARVGLRRARSVLRVFRPLLDPAWTSPLDAELGALGRLLGGLRDLDVLGARLHAAVIALPEQRDRLAAMTLTGRMADARRTALRRVSVHLMSPGFEALIDRALAAAEDLHPAVGVDLGAPAADHAAALVGPSWRALARDAHRATRRPPTDEQLHMIRIRAKRARYACDVVAPVAGRPADRLSKHLGRLQDVLGDLHDVAVFEDWLRGNATAVTVPRNAAFATGLIVAQQRAAATGDREAWPGAWAGAGRAAGRWPGLVTP